MKYNLDLEQLITTNVEVEADTEEEAIEIGNNILYNDLVAYNEYYLIAADVSIGKRAASGKTLYSHSSLYM